MLIFDDLQEINHKDYEVRDPFCGGFFCPEHFQICAVLDGSVYTPIPLFDVLSEKKRPGRVLDVFFGSILTFFLKFLKRCF